MMQTQWDAETMATGIETIDRQHQELLLALNEFLEAIEQQRDAEVIGKLMDFLTVYVMDHFACEEEMMEKHACPSHAVNIKAHERFRMEFDDIAYQFDSQGPSTELAENVRKKLLEWLVVHIQGCDAQLKKCTMNCTQ